MQIYVILFLLFSLLAVIEQITGKRMVPVRLLTIIFLVGFAALRPIGGDPDSESYATSFSQFIDPGDYIKNFEDWSYFEPLFYLIPSFYKTYFEELDYTFLTFLTIAFIAIPIKCFGIHKLSNFFFASILIYFSNFYLLHDMTQIRAGVAAGFVLLSIYLYKKRKFSTVIILLLFSMLFHYSSIIILILFFLNTEKVNKAIYASVLAITFILAFINPSFILSVFNINLGFLTVRSLHYIELVEYGLGVGINKLNSIFLLSYGLTALLLFNVEKLQKHNRHLILTVKIQVWALFMFQLFSAIPTLSFRLSELLLVSQIITIPILPLLFKNRWIGLLSIIIIAAFFFWINVFYIGIMQPHFK